MKWVLVVLCLLIVHVKCARGVQPNFHQSVEDAQALNVELLKQTLRYGWRAFCATPVDEGVMSLYNGVNPCDATLHVITLNNQSIDLPIKALSEIPDFDINPERKTLLYINAYFAEDACFSILAHLKLLQETRRDLNIIVVDFAKDILQLYTAIRHHILVQGYFVAKILSILTAQGINRQDITLVGHSVGANIAALGAQLYAEHSFDGLQLMGQLIAIDPAVMCHDSDIYVRPNVSERVVVIHGEGDSFGVRKVCGTIDIYPNGIGYFPRKKPQPGCEDNLCSHYYPFILFMEALIEGVMIPAVKCDNWMQFRKRNCDYSDTVAIGLKYPKTAAGVYFCMTQPSPPFTFMEHGLKYKKLKKSKNSIQ